MEYQLQQEAQVANEIAMQNAYNEEIDPYAEPVDTFDDPALAEQVAVDDAMVDPYADPMVAPEVVVDEPVVDPYAEPVVETEVVADQPFVDPYAEPVAAQVVVDDGMVDPYAQPVVETEVVVDQPQVDPYAEPVVAAQVVDDPMVDPYAELVVATDAVVDEPLVDPYAEPVAAEVVVDQPMADPYVEPAVESEVVVEQPVVDPYAQPMVAADVAVDEDQEMVDPYAEPAVVTDEVVVDEPVVQTEVVVDEPVIDPYAEPIVATDVVVDQPVVDTMADPYVEPAVEAQVVDQPFVDPYAEPVMAAQVVDDPMVDPYSQPVVAAEVVVDQPVVEAEVVVEDQPFVDPYAEPVVETQVVVDEPVADPYVEPEVAAEVVVDEPVADPYVETVTENQVFVQQPVIDPYAEAVVVNEPVIDPYAQPVVETEVVVEQPVIDPYAPALRVDSYLPPIPNIEQEVMLDPYADNEEVVVTPAPILPVAPAAEIVEEEPLEYDRFETAMPFDEAEPIQAVPFNPPYPPQQSSTIRPQLVKNVIVEEPISTAQKEEEIVMPTQPEAIAEYPVQADSLLTPSMESPAFFHHLLQWKPEIAKIEDDCLLISDKCIRISDLSKIKILKETYNNARQIKLSHIVDHFMALEPKPTANKVNLHYLWFAKLVNLKLRQRGFDFKNPFFLEKKWANPIIKSSFIDGLIFKRSQYLHNWQIRYIAISPDGLLSFKDEKTPESFVVKPNTSTELWTRFEMQDKMLVIKLHHGGRKTEFGIPIVDFTVDGPNNWLKHFYGLVYGY